MLNNSRLITSMLLVLFAVGCERLQADRHFNYGIDYYKDKKFEAAIRSFERASTHLSNPAIVYNLALAHLALLRESVGENDETEAPDVSAQSIEAALGAVRSALELPDLADEMRAKLYYVEGSVLLIANDEAAARRAFAESLSAKGDFEPTLGALVELSADSETPLAQLVLAQAEAGDPELEEKLTR
jgi:tetratricopeptide (TPR) repeat protein